MPKQHSIITASPRHQIAGSTPATQGRRGDNFENKNADGHTLLYTIDGPLTQLPHTMADLGYQPLEQLVPVTRASLGGSVLLVHSSIPADDLPSFLKWAQENPGKLSYASYGVGTLAHIYGAVLSDKFDLDMTHVPYKGSSDAMRDLAPEIREKINDAIHQAARSERVQQVWEAQGFEHVYETPADFEKAYQHAYQQWGEYIRQLGLAIN